MKLYTTELKAYLAGTAEIRTFRGPKVPGESKEDARNYCDDKGLGYLEITGIFDADYPDEINVNQP